MLRSASLVFKRTLQTTSTNFCKNPLKSQQNSFLASNTFKIKIFNPLTANRIIFPFSTEKHHKSHGHEHSHGHHHPHGSDPLTGIKKELETLSKQVQQKYPNQPELVIKELYEKCQAFVGQNKRVEILILFELISEFIEANNLVQPYSTFLIMSSNNSFLMGEYEKVERRCKFALPYEIKKHGQKHKNVGDIYNMLGISISKLGTGKGQQALEYLQKAFNVRKELFGQSGQTAEVLFNAGIIEQESQNMLEKAQKNFLDAIQMLQNCEIPTPLLYVKTKLRLAENQFKIHSSTSKYLSDLLRIEQVVDKFKTDKKFSKHEHPAVDMFMSLLHKSLGKKFMQINDFPKAIKYLDLCLIYLRQNKMETQDRIEVLEFCAAAHVGLEQYQKAAKLFEEGDKILSNFPASQEYKYHYLKYLGQIYRKANNFEKEQKTLERMRKLQKDSKQKFIQPEDILETQLRLIFSLGNAKKFDLVIEKGAQIFRLIQSHKQRFSVEKILEYKSNINAYVGFSHFAKGNSDLALEFFENSDKIFSELPSTTERNQFHLNILKKIALIHIQVRKDLEKGFFHLQRLRQILLSNKEFTAQKKLNDLVILLLDYEITPAPQQNVDTVMTKLVEAKYVQKINEVLAQIVKLSKQIVTLPQAKQILQSYYFLLVSIHQMILSFNEMKPYEGKYETVSKTKQLLGELIQVYDQTFEKEIQQINNSTFKGDQVLAEFIRKVANVKTELQNLSITQ